MALKDGIRFVNGVGLVAIEVFRSHDYYDSVGYNLLAQERTAVVSGGRPNTIGVTAGGFMGFHALDVTHPVDDPLLAQGLDLAPEGTIEPFEAQLWREFQQELPRIGSVMTLYGLQRSTFPIRGGQFSVKMGSLDRFGNNIHCCHFYGMWVTSEMATGLIGLAGSSEAKRLVRRRLPVVPTLENVQLALPDLYHTHEAIPVTNMLMYAQGSWLHSSAVAVALWRRLPKM